jgi:hypothetical protein
MPVAKAASWASSKRWAQIEQLLDQVLDQREAREQALAAKLERLRVRQSARRTNSTSSGERVVPSPKRRRRWH